MDLMIKDNREMCCACPIDKITQGSIFNHAFNEDFECDDDLGMLISARCDLANNKSPKYSYLPVITLKNHISFNIVSKLLTEQRSEEINKIKSLIKTEGENPATVDLYGARKSVEKLISKEKNRVKADLYLSNIDIIEQLKTKKWSEYQQSDFSIIPEKKFKSELKNLAENKTEGFFLIDEVIDHNDAKNPLGPHVVLLREVHHMSAEVATYIQKGCNHDDLLSKNISLRPLDLKAGRMSYVLCNVSSPFIELIMQRFSNLFTRIGVQNPSNNLASNFFSAYISE